MIVLRKLLPFVVTVTVILALPVFQAAAVAPGPKVSATGNKHNLSSGNVSNPYHATSADPRGEQVCIFCHTPHSANSSGQTPLWNRNFSSTVFQRYTGSTAFRIKGLAVAQYGPTGQPNYVIGAQPNGSSKLCLSCHDGVSRLGAVYSGPEIPMTTDVISGLASFNPALPANKLRYGHHPVSFVYATGFSYVNATNLVPAAQNGTVIAGLPVDYVFPQLIGGAVVVKLKDTLRDGRGWMQCTTCHDPHQNQSDDDDCYGACGPGVQKKAPFWVSHTGTNTATQDHDAVCTACHALVTPAPWP